jgi:hypothetical protein
MKRIAALCLAVAVSGCEADKKMGGINVCEKTER